jgi:hypothetical protein
MGTPLPEEWVCTPYQIAYDQVYYRHEFRKESTSQRERAVNWNEKVAPRAPILTDTSVAEPVRKTYPVGSPQGETIDKQVASTFVSGPSFNNADTSYDLSKAADKDVAEKPVSPSANNNKSGSNSPQGKAIDEQAARTFASSVVENN